MVCSFFSVLLRVFTKTTNGCLNFRYEIGNFERRETKNTFNIYALVNQTDSQRQIVRFIPENMQRSDK